MSLKNNVNPNHYKEKGRTRQGEDIVQEDHRETLAREESERQTRQREQAGKGEGSPKPPDR